MVSGNKLRGVVTVVSSVAGLVLARAVTGTLSGGTKIVVGHALRNILVVPQIQAIRL